MTSEMSEIYGLSQEPVRVAGTLNLTLDLGDGQIAEHTFEVLLGTQNTCILGRDLLSKFGNVEFNWLDNQIRIGDVWKDPQVTIQGGEPLARAYLLETFDFITPNPGRELEVIERNETSEE